MPEKPKNPQKKNPSETQKGDALYTPNYATDLIGPYVPTRGIWECCAGDGIMGNRLKHRWNKDVLFTEINGNFEYCNFLLDKPKYLGNNVAIVTNPPFSLKKEFVEKCVEYDVPFALLLPLDYSQWICEYIPKYNLEKLIPNRRISYLTPTVVERVNTKIKIIEAFLLGKLQK